MRVDEMYSGRARSNPRILVVDADPLDMSLLVKLLGSARMGDVEGVAESSEVMGTIRSFEPDVVLLDVDMTMPSGWTLLEMLGRAHEDGSFVPVIALSADESGQTNERALSSGAADVVTKPFSAIEVVLRVKNQLRVRGLVEQSNRRLAALRSEVDMVSTADHAARDRIRRVTRVVEEADSILTMVYQPIVEMGSGLTVGAEALARFNVIPIRPPNEWFAEAVEAGVDLQLELAAVRKAMSEADGLPEDAFVSVNVSPSTLRSRLFGELVAGGCGRPMVIELTERDRIEDFAPIRDAVSRLRGLGALFAVDDAGSGFASLHHLVELQPDFVKFSRQIVAGIDGDPTRRSLVTALMLFAAETGSTLIAQGIETPEELEVLRELGVSLGQGYHIGRPDHLPMPGHARASLAHAGSSPERRWR